MSTESDHDLDKAGRKPKIIRRPRVRFCWECGNQLRGNHHEEMEVEGHMRILHKECAMHIKNGHRHFKRGDTDEAESI